MLSTVLKQELEHYLKQDLGKKDVTTALVIEKNCISKIKANENCVVAGIEEINYLFKSRKLKIKTHVKDGAIVKKNEKIITIQGSNKKILTLERICLNVLGRMSGVATITKKAVQKSKTKIALTRKTVPGFQLFDKKAGAIAGALTHRKNLEEMILLKENHLLFFDDIRTAIKKAKKTRKKVEVETENEKQSLLASEENPNIIMLDNFSPKNAKETIKKLRKKGFSGQIELSGGITLKNISKYSNAGADFISMGELTKKARIIDFSLDVKK